MGPVSQPIARLHERRGSVFADVYSRAAIALLIAHAALAWWSRRPGILTGQDDAIYVLLARALHALQYRELYRIDQPLHMMYPPVYPALLAVWSAIGGEGFNWLILICLASSVGALALTFSALRAVWGPAAAIACLAALAVNPSLIDTAGAIASEAPYTFFVVLTLWAFTRHAESPRLAALAGAASIAAALTRSIGVTLIGAIFLYWLWRQRFRTVAIYAAAVALTVGLWLGWTTYAPELVPGKSYIADASASLPGRKLSSILIDRVTNKAPYALTIYLQLPVGIPPTKLIDKIIGIPIVVAALAAGSLTLLATWPVAFVHLAAYGSLLLLWAWPVPRFVVPVLPLLVPTALAGFGRLIGLFRLQWKQGALFVAAGALVVHGLGTVYGVIDAQKRCDPGAPVPSRACLDDDQASFFSAVQYIRDHVPADAVFVSGKSPTLYFYTGHRVVSLASALNHTPPEFLPFLEQQHVTHILLLAVMPFSDSMPSFSGLALGPMLKANCERLHLQASFPPSSYLFRLPAAGERPNPVAACRAVDTYFQAEQQHRVSSGASRLLLDH